MINDKELIDGLINKNKECEDFFYAKYSDIIKKTIEFNFNDVKYVEDDVSDVILKILSNIGKYDHTKSNLNTWVSSITRNHMIDKWRKNTTKGFLADKQFTSDYSLDNCNYIFNTTNDFENQNTLNYLAEQISTSDYDLLEMKYLFGYNYNEIAKEVGTTSETVSNRVNYIKTKLKNSNLELCYED